MRVSMILRADFVRAVKLQWGPQLRAFLGLTRKPSQRLSDFLGLTAGALVFARRRIVPRGDKDSGIITATLACVNYRNEQAETCKPGARQRDCAPTKVL